MLSDRFQRSIKVGSHPVSGVFRAAGGAGPLFRAGPNQYGHRLAVVDDDHLLAWIQSRNDFREMGFCVVKIHGRHVRTFR